MTAIKRLVELLVNVFTARCYARARSCGSVRWDHGTRVPERHRRTDRRTIFSSLRFDHISPLLSRLHSGCRFLSASPARSLFCRTNVTRSGSGAKVYLCDERRLRRPADTESRRRLRSPSSTTLDGQSISCHSSSSAEQSSVARHCCPPSIFCSRLKSHLLSLLTFLSRFLTLLSLYSARAVSRHFGHYDRYCI